MLASYPLDFLEPLFFLRDLEGLPAENDDKEERDCDAKRQGKDKLAPGLNLPSQDKVGMRCLAFAVLAVLAS